MPRTEPSQPGDLCGVCYDMPHRRPVEGPCRCGEYFEPREPPRAVDYVSRGETSGRMVLRVGFRGGRR